MPAHDLANEFWCQWMPLAARPSDLPDFQRPPVTEVVLSIQFASIDGLQNVHAGLLWDLFRNEYPVIHERPPLDPVFETFGAAPTPPSPPTFKIQALLSPPMHRYWFEEAEGAELVQIQQDRIIHNWRKRQAEQEYPRYEQIRARFEADITKFENFLKEENLGGLRPNQCEVTYINSIELPLGENPHVQLKKITPLWSGENADDYLPEMDSAVLNVHYVLRKNGRPFGRAHVIVTPAMRFTDNVPVIQLEITVRGKPEDESIAAALRLLDQGRDAVVRTFAAVTTVEMHKIWGRTDA